MYNYPYMEPWLIIIIIVIGVLLLASLGFVIYISNLMVSQMCKPKHYVTHEEKLTEVASLFDIDKAKSFKREPIQFVMLDGYVLHGDYSLNNPKKFVICMHGHTSIRDSSLKYAYSFYRLGYSLVFFDHRSHGDNVRDYVTMGYREHQDALEVIKQVKAKFGEDIELGLFGCSMGGATSLMCLKERDDLSFVVSDCAFASLKDLVRGFCVIHKSIPFFFLGPTNLFLKLRFHFSFKDASALKAVSVNTKVPVLFIHGDKDDFVFPINATKLYKAYNGPKRLEMFEEAVHCGSIIADRERYYKVIEEFIEGKIYG